MNLHVRSHPLLRGMGLAIIGLAGMFLVSIAAASPKAKRGAFAEFKTGGKKRKFGGKDMLRGPKKRFQRRKKTIIRLPQTPQRPAARTKAPKKGAPAIGKGDPGMPKKGTTADEVAARKAAVLRRQRIKMMMALLRQIKGNTPSVRAQQAQLYHRLIESYLDEAKYLYFIAMRRHTRQLDAWVKRCDALRDKKRPCGPKPKPKLAKSQAYRSQSVSVARLLLRKHPQYQRSDEVQFTLLLSLQRLKRYKDAKRVFLRFRRRTKSRFLADSYMVMADQAFKRNVVNDAWRYYKQAMAIAKRRYANAKSPSVVVRMRGVHLRSMYMLAWCNLNIGDLRKSLRGFQRVQRLSRLYEKTKQSKILFGDESLRDMLTVYAKMGKAKPAYRYLRKLLGPVKAHKATRHIARSLVRLGNDKAAVKAYEWLLGIAPKGQRDNGHVLVPQLLMALIESAKKVETPAKVYVRIRSLMQRLAPGHPWHKRWHKTKAWAATANAAEQSMVTWSVAYHKKAQSIEKKKPAKAEVFYNYAIKLYRSYLLAFPQKESSRELRFFLAELLYRKATRVQGRRRGLRTKARRLFAQAARHYRIVGRAKAARRGNPYRKPATFAEMLCYERLAGRSRRFRPRRINTSDLTVDAQGRVTWKRDVIKKSSAQARLIDAYRRYLKLARDKEERLQTYFKLGVLYAAHRYYLRSTDIFSAMTREFPRHELSRRAAFMILYSYQDLRQWKKLEASARRFLKDPKLTRNKSFRLEMYGMLIRSAYKPYLQEVIQSRKAKKQPSLTLAKRFLRYANEFGVSGPWVQKGYKASPRAPHALAVAADCFTRRQELFAVIRARRALIKLYPKHSLVPSAILSLGTNFEQIAAYEQAAHWLERYANLTPTQAPAKRRRTNKAPKPASSQSLAKGQKKRADALYRAAVYRRGLGQYDVAIRLYRTFMKRYPLRSETSVLPLAIAQTYETAQQWPKAMQAYQQFLRQRQTPALRTYLDKAVALMQREMPKQGLISRLAGLHRKGKRSRQPLLLRRLGKVNRADVQAKFLMLAHARIAALLQRAGAKGATKRLARLMKIEALGFQMYLHKLPAMGLGQSARDAYAEARFYLVETQRSAFLKRTFVGHRSRDRKTLKTLLKIGRRMARDYAEVAMLQSAGWVLAAVFRTGQIYHVFSKKLIKAPIPKVLRGEDAVKYRRFMQQMAMRVEEPALDAYEAVLRKSAELGLYNRWVQLCERARAKLTRREGRVNPYTIFRRRPAAYWVVDLNPLRLNLRSLRPQPRRAVPLRRRPVPQPLRPVPRRR